MGEQGCFSVVCWFPLDRGGDSSILGELVLAGLEWLRISEKRSCIGRGRHWRRLLRIVARVVSVAMRRCDEVVLWIDGTWEGTTVIIWTTSGPKFDELSCYYSRRFDLRGHEVGDLLLPLRGQIVRSSSR